MSKRIGASTILLENKVGFLSFAAVGGKKEAAGPFADCYDCLDQTDRFGQESFEEAESAMQSLCLQTAIEKAEISAADISFLLGGDLLNQCIGTSFGAKDFKIPFLGIYGACSTISEGLLIGSALTDSGAAQRAAVITSSHFCSAERQYRLPLDYGGQRTPTAQWTATASGALILEKTDKPPFVKALTVGTIQDKGIKDANNMGAAMAPAAFETLKTFFVDTQTTPRDFDLIVTGDLGHVGSRILRALFEAENQSITQNHRDCGAMLFDHTEQDVHAGASGCGCAASMLCGHFLPEMRKGKIKNMLFLATGALLSPISAMQSKSIPSISHLAWLTNERN